ncbi:MAG: SRPBCC domain-containing protein [Bacteroidota bacterium]
MKESLELTATFKATPQAIYDAWLDSAGHEAMTGGGATCSQEVGAAHTAWDGYITGENLALTPHSEIVQTWRTSEFASDDEDSKLIVRLEAVEGGCAVTLIHTHIPEGQTQYVQGWEDHYFAPMREHFGTLD